jgi:hypothetical protein
MATKFPMIRALFYLPPTVVRDGEASVAKRCCDGAGFSPYLRWLLHTTRDVSSSGAADRRCEMASTRAEARC